VEEGVAFCPECKAPQIRVNVQVETAGPELTPDTAPVFLPPPSLGPATIQWSRVFGPVAMAGLIAFLLVPFFFGVFGLGMILAGILTVVFYHWRAPGTSLTPGIGLRLGALSGLFGFLLLSFFVVSAIALSGWSQLRLTMQQAIARSPQASEPQSRQILELIQNQQGLTALVTACMIVAFLIMVVLTSLGGGIGAFLLRRKPRE
jgi:hypothetical protein